MADYDIGAAFEKIEDELISSMIRNLKRHQVEEITEGIQWTQWQAEQIQALEEYKRKAAQKFRAKFSSTPTPHGLLCFIMHTAEDGIPLTKL